MGGTNLDVLVQRVYKRTGLVFCGHVFLSVGPSDALDRRRQECTRKKLQKQHLLDSARVCYLNWDEVDSDSLTEHKVRRRIVFEGASPKGFCGSSVTLVTGKGYSKDSV